jgi:flavin-dependent dehydrogenase
MSRRATAFLQNLRGREILRTGFAVTGELSYTSTDSMNETTCDVAILGGAFSGAATAVLIKRRCPEARVVIVEKAAEFDRKVGESTTEVSSCFLTRVLGLTQHLGHEQLAKQGLRFWFARSKDEAFDECAEVGARYNSRLQGFQVDRAKLDEHVLGLARESGAELWRPAKVTKVELGGAGKNVVQARAGEETKTLRAKWVIDATGRVAMLARQLDLFRPNTDHPVNSLWARFRGVKDWDGAELRKRFPRWANATFTARTWATNHLVGYGWWCWIIPLKGGDTSVGLVYDSRLFQPPEGANIGERLKKHFESHPVGREILGQAQPVEGDQRAYSALAYSSEKIAGDGWAMVGDAASFIDPLYSSGLDFCGFTASAATALVAKSLGGEGVGTAIVDTNTRFEFCYRAWFDSIYRDKYFYLGDAELMSAAFLIDVASYHLGPVRQVFSDPERQFEAFPFDGKPGEVVHRILSFFNRRLALLAQRKRAAGIYGHDNAGWRLLIPGFLPDSSSGKIMLRGIQRWLRAEWRHFGLRHLRTMPAEELKAMAGPSEAMAAR